MGNLGPVKKFLIPFGLYCRYVVEKDVKNNVVFVSRNYFSFDKRRRLFRVGSLKWLSGLPPNQMSQLQCKVKNSNFSFHVELYVTIHT